MISLIDKHFNKTTIEGRAYMSNYTSLFYMDEITYSCSNPDAFSHNPKPIKIQVLSEK